MEGNGWNPAQGDSAIAANDWRSRLSAQSRQKIVDRIMDTLLKYVPNSRSEDAPGLNEIAVRFEEKTYTSATSQADYVKRISLKMLTMEPKSTNTNSLLSYFVNGDQNPPHQAVESMQQAWNQGQSLSIPLVNPSQGQQFVSQNFQNSITHNPVHSSSGCTPTPSSMTGITYDGLSSDLGKICNAQNTSGASQNTVNNAIGHGVIPNMFSDSQKQIQARHLLQQAVVEQHQQQSQNHHQLQNQHVLMNEPMQQKGNIQQSLSQPPNVSRWQLQPNQMQSTPQSLVQASQQPPLPKPGQPYLQQSQVSGIQTSQPSVIQHGEQTSPPHSVPSVIQQHQLSFLRHKQPQQSSMQSQPSVLHQQPSQISQSTILPQHRMFNQQILPNIHRQQQQQQLAGQPSNMQHIHQQPQQLIKQAKPSLHQHPQQTSAARLQQHAPQPQLQPSQQLVTQLQPPSTQARQKITTQQQSNSLQGELERIQCSDGLPQAAVEQKKQLFQQQRGLADTTLYPTVQTIHSDTVDWQEEAFQKVKALKDMYFNELYNLYQRLALKCQQYENLQAPVHPDQLEKLKHCRNVLKSILTYLSIPKKSISTSLKDKIGTLEKQVLQMLHIFKIRRFVAPSQQEHQQPPSESGGRSLSLHDDTQQAQQRISHLSQHDSHANHPQSVNIQNTVTSMQPSSVTVMQHGGMPSGQHLGVQSPQQNLQNVLHSGSHLDTSSLGSIGQGAITSLSQGVVGSFPQNTLYTGQQSNATTLPQSSATALHTNANLLQHQQEGKQSQPQHEQHMVPQSQPPHQCQRPQIQMQQKQIQQQMVSQSKLPHQCQQPQIQMQQKQIQQQMVSQSQLPYQCQQQQIQMHQKQKHSSQLPAHRFSAVDDLNVNSGMTHKLGQQQQQLSIGQCATAYQELKTASSVPSTQLTHATYSQISHNSSPQVDQVQQGQLSIMSLPKVVTPLQAANSPFVVRSPSTSIAPSPVSDVSEKTGASPLSNTVNMVNQPSLVMLGQAQSLAVGTPGISASPLLAEIITRDGNQVGHATALGSNGKTNTIERPLDRLIKAVTSVSSKAFRSSVSDISSVVNLIDRMAGSAPGNGSRTPVGEDLVAITRCRLQARNIITQDPNAATRKLKRNPSTMPLNTLATGSVNSSILPLDVESSELDPTATSRKRSRIEVRPTILEELKEINLKLIDTVVDVSSEENDITAVNAEGGDGIVVKCSYTGVALRPNMKSESALMQTRPILPLRLLLPSNYPKCSPVLLDTLPVEVSEEGEDLSSKAKRRFTLLLWGLQQPMSLGDMVRTWDVCARQVMTEYAQRSGGGSFSSSYGVWESCMGA